jgi:AcrR family transcriptional regulator
MSEIERHGEGDVDGPAAIRAARASWRVGQIVGAATRLLSAEGFHKVSVSSLASEAGISVGTIYQYVSSKEDILEMVVVDILEAYRREVPAAMEGVEDPLERLAAGFRAYCKVVDSLRAATLLGYQESKALSPAGLERIKQLEVETNQYFGDCIRDGVRDGKFVAVDPDVTSFTLAMLAHEWALKHWWFKDRLDLDGYVDQQLRLVLRGLVRDQAEYERLMGTRPEGGSELEGL